MKKFRLLLILCLALQLNYSYAQTWEWQYPKPSGDNHWGVCMTDSLTAYVSQTDGTILKTINGGIDWTTLYTGSKSPISKICFPDKNTGFAQTMGSILKTQDAGLTWSYLNIGLQDWFSVDDVFFPTTSTGYAIFYGGIHKTIDGGESWSYNNLSSSPHSLFFINQDIGYAGGFNNKFYKTINGGETWITINIQVGIDLIYVNKLFFVDENVGYASGNESDPWSDDNIMVKTIDGGLNWELLNVTNDNWWGSEMYFSSADTGFIVGTVYSNAENEYYNILKTTDGGNTWNYYSPRYWNFWLAQFNRIAFCKQNAIAVGWFGLIGKSIDSGENWTLLSSIPTQGFRDICFVNKDKGFVVGDEGLHKTNDGGSNWIKQEVGIPWGINICFPDSTIGYINSGRTLYKTIDGGSTWDTIFTYDTTCVSMNFPTKDTGYLAGNDGIVMKTVNGGLDWTTVRVGNDGGYIRTIRFTNNRGFIIYGDISECWQTNDGGITWFVFNPLFNKVSDIFFTSSQVGYLHSYDDYGSMNYKTTNGGQSWVKLNTRYNYDDWREYSGYIYFLNDSVGFMYESNGHPSQGNGSSCIKTTDGGQSWEYFKFNSGHQFQLESACFTDENTGYMVSAFGGIGKLNMVNKKQWAPDGAEWYYSFSSVDKEGYIKIFPTGDTLIQDLKFRALQKTCVYYDYQLQKIDSLNLDKEYMREDLGNIAWYKNDSIYTLYNFATSPGTSWEVPGTFIESCDSVATFKIKSKETINVNGKNLLKINFVSYSDWNYNLGTQAIQGIGSIDGYLLPEPTLACNIGALNHGGPFRCYSDSILGFYSTNIAPYCDYTIDIQTIDYATQLKTYPNPSKDFVVFDYNLPMGTYDLKIYDFRGILVQDFHLNGGTNKVQWVSSMVSPGIYFYSITNIDAKITGKIIITQ